jgi:hypothetical protein
MIPPTLDPAHQHHLATLVRDSQGVQVVGSFPVSQLIECHDLSLLKARYALSILKWI